VNTVEKMLQDAIAAIKNSSKESIVYIGCDSKRYKKKGVWFARYATVVIVHKDGRHGCNLFFTEEHQPDYGILKQRLMTEVGMAVQAGMGIVDHLDGRRLEIHLDINPNPIHKSNIACKEAIGWCRGMGFDTKVKPDSFAAMHAADYVVNH
jgi:predicted RNase H-related nuclease YkuK (DUF458 family)